MRQRASRSLQVRAAGTARGIARLAGLVDLADLHVYGGLALVWWGVSAVSPWAARVVVGVALVVLGVAGARLPVAPVGRR